MPTISRVIGIVEELLVGPNPYRTMIIVVNNSAALTLYVTDVQGQAGTGIPILAGGNLEMNQVLGWETERPWWIIASGAGAIAVITENFQRSETTPAPMPKPQIIPKMKKV